ncbi:unnamed protein product [Soboliphyme baturini]|uniref:PH domain-containing protein n=1 Tax=Soboliphyme baturini TaxID=241478 RepID=A0A183J1I6_9BILA|nr:unnamed protein product [Soboliphyme baturini]
MLNKLSYVKEEPCDSNKPLFKFIVKAANRTYVFATRDKLNQQEWIAGIQLAIARCDISRNYYLESYSKRRFKTGDSIRRTKKEMIPAITAIDRKLNGTLLYENGSGTIENKLAKELKRCSRLEEEKKQLAQQLEVEKKATKDEEIVRRLAVQMIEDERTEKERLLMVCRELQHELDKERNERKDLETRLAMKRAEMEKVKHRLKNILNSDTGDYLIDRSLPRTFRYRCRMHTS